MTYHVRPALLTDIPDIVKDLVPAGLEDISRTNNHPVLRILVDGIVTGKLFCRI